MYVYVCMYVCTKFYSFIFAGYCWNPDACGDILGSPSTAYFDNKVHTYIHTYTYTYILTYTHTFIYTYMDIYSNMNLHIAYPRGHVSDIVERV